VSPAEFQAWVLKQQGKASSAASNSVTTLSKTDLMTLGKAAYEKNCSACHQVDGKGLPPAFPALKDNEIVTGPMNQQIQIVLHGIKNTPMQAFGDQLDNQTIAAIITYTRNAWGNHTVENTVQPNDVQKNR